MNLKDELKTTTQLALGRSFREIHWFLKNDDCQRTQRKPKVAMDGVTLKSNVSSYQLASFYSWHLCPIE